MAISELGLKSVATDKTISSPPGPGVGQPEASRQSEIVLIEIAKLQNDGEYTKRDLGELRADMRDVRDRLARVEEAIKSLPGKGFMVTATLLALAAIGALSTFHEQIQAYIGRP